MKKLLLGTLTVVLIFALTGWATETRVMTLGDANNIVKDVNNIWLYPSTINMYPNMAIGEFGTQAGWDFDKLGVHYAFGETETVFGLYLDQVNDMMNPYSPNNVTDPMGGNAGIDHRINFFFGMPMGDNQFGAHLAYYGDSYSVEGDSATGPWGGNTNMSNMKIDFAAGLTLNENLDVALMFGFQSWTNEGADGKAITEPKGNVHLGFGVRYWMDFGNDYVGIPHFSFNYVKMGKETAADTSEDVLTAMILDLGWGMNLNPDDRIMAVGDFGFTYQSVKDTHTPSVGADVELSDSDFILPYFRLGLEGYLTDWWDVRVGAVKKWHMTTDGVTADVDQKYGYAGTDTYLGSAIHLGNMTLDVQVNPLFLQDGPYFVSGAGQALTERVSLTYEW